MVEDASGERGTPSDRCEASGGGRSSIPFTSVRVRIAVQGVSRARLVLEQPDLEPRHPIFLNEGPSRRCTAPCECGTSTGRRTASAISVCGERASLQRTISGSALPVRTVARASAWRCRFQVRLFDLQTEDRAALVNAGSSRVTWRLCIHAEPLTPAPRHAVLAVPMTAAKK
jgi:hypothetical protein